MPKKSTANAVGIRGKAVQFWTYDSDKEKIAELRTYLVTKGKRPSDSLIIRSALKAAKGNAAFMQAYEAIEELDGRLKQHRQEKKDEV